MAAMMQIGQTVLNRYRIVDLIQDGGQASVAKAADKRSGAPVAIRKLAASPGQPHYQQELARFQRAADLRIGHTAVVDPTDAGEENGEWYMVTPFIDGVDLENHTISRGGKLPVNEALSIIGEVADGLAAIHAKGVIHRDLKPANILIDRDGHPHILDFGICRIIHEATITQGSGLFGSLPYMAPEQVACPGSEDHRTDLYALGAVFHFLLTGQAPVQGNDPAQVALSICQWTPPSLHQTNASIPTQVDRACMRLLAKNPDSRFQSTDEFRRAVHVSGGSNGGAGFCISCGTPMLPGGRYCHQCGAEDNAGQSMAIQCLACGVAVAEAAVCPACNRRFGQPGHRLHFRTGPLTGKVFRAPEGIYDVGRDQLSPRDQHISRRQFRVACSNGSMNVEDAGSTNKTYVGGQAADHVVLLQPAQELWVAGNSAIYANH